MATQPKVLGQASPAGATPTDIYTVPGATKTTVSTVYVCNRSAVASSFRISVRVAGAGDSNEQYLYYDVPIEGNDSFAATVGITLAATDVVTVYANSATLSFNLFGIEEA